MKNRRRSGKRPGVRRGLGKPVIGITCEVVKTKPYFAEFDLVCDYRYIRAILRSGGIPILLPVLPFPRDASRMLESIDGLVIIGGADIHPTFYKEKSKDKIFPIYRGRTYFEMKLFRLAQQKKIPILGICYGMQLINVIYGGSLHQDIKSEIDKARSHASKKTPLHHVTVQPGSICHKIFGKTSFPVHSSHHQAVKIPGKSLRVTAYAEDGIPEAIEGPPRTLAVQWHPERQPKDPVQIKIFRYFIRMAREQRQLREKLHSRKRHRS